MKHYYSVISPRQSDLMHYGKKGMKWGVITKKAETAGNVLKYGTKDKDAIRKYKELNASRNYHSTMENHYRNQYNQNKSAAKYGVTKKIRSQAKKTASTSKKMEKIHNASYNKFNNEIRSNKATKKINRYTAYRDLAGVALGTIAVGRYVKKHGRPKAMVY